MPFAKNADTIELLNLPSVKNYYENTNVMSKSSADEYIYRLKIFNEFLNKEHNGITIETLLEKIKDGTIDIYNILSRYGSDQKNCNISATTIKQRVVTVKNFFEYHDIEVSPRKFKLKVRLPKSVRKNKEALSKEDIADILNHCSDIKLKTYVMLLAATGMRASEALHIRIKDIDFEKHPTELYIRGENTKTKTDRIIFLTEEIASQLDTWLKYKYRTRRVCYEITEDDDIKEITNKKTVNEYRTPSLKKTDLVFASSNNSDQSPDPYSLYVDLSNSFAKTLDRMGKGEREENNERRRQITFHSFRRFVKSTISDLGYSDYSEWFIGHSGSTYYRKKESEKIETFRKIEPYLTFLNVYQLERQGADIQAKIEELEFLNQSLRERDKSKDDSISMLADQIVNLTERLKEIEQKQYQQKIPYN
ncbi:MAG TPA: site-specific integrase [Verrucomicrobiae bacterium]|jgi:integrase|nr:site-specific integrase [Verrucomicrobiae bacterium]